MRETPADQPDPELIAQVEDAWEKEDYELLLELLPEILRSQPENANALHQKSVAELMLGKKEDFLATVDRAISAGTGLGFFLTLKANGLILFGDLAAREAAEAAIQADEDHPPAWLALAQACLGSEDLEVALNAAERAYELDEEDSASLKVLVQAVGANDDFARADELAGLFLEREGDDSLVLNMKAAALAQLDRNQDAVETAERAYDLNPKDPSTLRTLAAALVLEGDYERAEEIQNKWVEIEPSVTFTWVGLGLIKLMLGRWEEAAAALRRGSELSPDDPMVKVWLASALIELGEAEEALTMMIDLSDSNPKVEAVWLERAAAERTLGFNDGAVASARQGLETGGFDSAEGWMELARCYSQAGRHQNAWRAFGKVAQIDGESEEAALGLAVESILCHKEARALDELREAEKRFGPTDLFEFNRGVALYKLGKEGAAREAWGRARDLNPELGAAEVLGGQSGAGVEPGSWQDHWFGAAAGRGRKVIGALLLGLLLFFMAVPLLKKDLIPGVETGDASLEGFIPALLVVLLLALPAIKSLAVGSVSMDVTPIGSPDPPPTIDPAQVLPVFADDELDVTQLTRT